MLEDLLAVMVDHRGLAMHKLLCPDDPPAERVADRLMPKADSQDREFACELLDQ